MARQDRSGGFCVETERLTIGPVAAADRAAFHAIAKRHDVACMLASLPHPLSPEGAAAWLAARRYRGRPGFAAGIYRRDGPLIGCIGLVDEPRTVYYFLGPESWGRGYATEALTAFLAACAGRFGLTEIRAGAMHDNLGSHRVLEKAGFRFTHVVRHRPPVREAPDRLFMFWKGFGAPAPFVVHTKRLYIVPIRAPYAARLSALGNDPAVARMAAGIPHPFTPEQAAAWIDGADPAAGQHRLAIASQEGFMLGACRLEVEGRGGAVNGWLARDNWGRGLGGEAAKGLISEAFLRHPELAQLDCRILPDNPAADRVLQNCGFMEVPDDGPPRPAGRAALPSRLFRIARNHLPI